VHSPGDEADWIKKIDELFQKKPVHAGFFVGGIGKVKRQVIVGYL